MKKTFTLVLAFLLLLTGGTLIPAYAEETDESDILIAVQETAAPEEETIPISETMPAEESVPEEGTVSETGSTEEDISGSSAKAASDMIAVKQPESVSAIANEPVSFMFGVQASGGVTYQWQVSSDRGSTWSSCGDSNTRQTLRVTALPGMDGYQYRCIATQYGTQLISKTASLTVTTGVTITSHPWTAYAKAGGTASFSARASGTGISYQWQYTKDGGTTWTNCSSASFDQPDFVFTASAGLNGRKYRCAVSNEYGFTLYSDAAALSVLSVSSQPEAQKTAAGKTATFTVSATGSGLSYQWQYAKAGSSTWNNCSSQGYNTPTFSFTSSMTFDGRRYRCVITDPAGNRVTSSAVPFTCVGGPTITTQPTASYVKSGGSASFTVTASGSGLTYQWQVSKDGGSTWKNCSTEGSTSRTFIFAAKPSYTGWYYRCRVTNSAGLTTVSGKAMLSVLSISAQPKAQKIAVGKKATFTVTATGSGLTYQWQVSKDGGSTWKNCTTTGNRSKSFGFEAKASYSGWLYRCVVKDGGGNSFTTSRVRLTVGVKPTIKTHPAFRRAGSGTTVAFSVSATGEGTLTYQWQYSKNGGSSWVNCKSSGYDTATFRFTATSGLDGRLYRCVVGNDFGKTYSSSALFELDLGCAHKITGRTVILSVFASDSTCSWDWNNSDDLNRYWDCHTKLGSAVSYLKTKVSGYGYSPEFIYDWTKDQSLACTVNFSDRQLVRFDGSEAWFQANWLSEHFDPDEIKAKYEADNVVYIFFFDSPLSTEARSWMTACGHIEFVNIFVGSNGYIQPPSTYAHEILHTFGAPDMYYANSTITQDYVDHLGDIGSGDIMYTVYTGDTVTNQFTELDAYYVGLTNTATDQRVWNLGVSEFVA